MLCVKDAWYRDMWNLLDIIQKYIHSLLCVYVSKITIFIYRFNTYQNTLQGIFMKKWMRAKSQNTHTSCYKNKIFIRHYLYTLQVQWKFNYAKYFMLQSFVIKGLPTIKRIKLNRKNTHWPMPWCENTLWKLKSETFCT